MPTIGAVGVVGCTLIVTLVLADTHPVAFCAVTLYVPGATEVNTPVVLV